MANEEIWAETTDGGLLRQLFGHFPTLHDAAIQEIRIDRTAALVTMTVHYRDTVGDNVQDNLEAIIRLEWRGVRSFDLPLGETDLFGLTFARSGSDVITHLELFPGHFGQVVSEAVEAVLLQVHAKPTDDRPWLRMR